MYRHGLPNLEETVADTMQLIYTDQKQRYFEKFGLAEEIKTQTDKVVRVILPPFWSP
jgi:hypothetical protein